MFGALRNKYKIGINRIFCNVNYNNRGKNEAQFQVLIEYFVM